LSEELKFFRTSTIVTRLVFFMQRFWDNKIPTTASEKEKSEFLKWVNRWRNWYLGCDRELEAAILFDKFQMRFRERYESEYCLNVTSTSILNKKQAYDLALEIAEGLLGAKK
jgi:hypothetical protein